MDNIVNYLLEFGGFNLEFAVNQTASAEETRASSLRRFPDFVFATADIWVQVNATRSLLISAFDTGNLIETLRYWETKNNSIPMPSGLERIIKRGALCQWMREYWQRIRDDCSLPDDESTYGLVEPLFWVANDSDSLAAYEYENTFVIEVASQAETGDIIEAYSELDREKTAFNLSRLREQITAAIQ